MYRNITNYSKNTSKMSRYNTILWCDIYHNTIYSVKLTLRWHIWYALSLATMYI